MSGEQQPRPAETPAATEGRHVAAATHEESSVPPTGLQEEIKKRKPFELPEQEACLNVLKTQDLLLGELNGLFKRYGLSHPKYNVLRIIRGVGGKGVSCQEIAARMINRVPDITRLVDGLAQAGLATRNHSTTDRRVVLVKLTAKGKRLLARLDQPVNALNKSQLGHMTRKELAELNRLLVKARQRRKTRAS